MSVADAFKEKIEGISPLYRHKALALLPNSRLISNRCKCGAVCRRLFPSYTDEENWYRFSIGDGYIIDSIYNR